MQVGLSIRKTLLYIKDKLLTHQKRLRFGDELQTMSSIADRAGVHRDTLYALLNGDRISLRSQYAIDRALREVEEENVGVTKTRVMNVSLSPDGPRLGFGVSATKVLG